MTSGPEFASHFWIRAFFGGRRGRCPLPSPSRPAPLCSPLPPAGAASAAALPRGWRGTHTPTPGPGGDPPPPPPPPLSPPPPQPGGLLRLSTARPTRAAWAQGANPRKAACWCVKGFKILIGALRARKNIQAKSTPGGFCVTPLASERKYLRVLFSPGGERLRSSKSRKSGGGGGGESTHRL